MGGSDKERDKKTADKEEKKEKKEVCFTIIRHLNYSHLSRSFSLTLSSFMFRNGRRRRRNPVG